MALSDEQICQKLDMCPTENTEDEWSKCLDPAATRAMVQKINSSNTTWVAGENTKFAGSTLADVRQYLGTIVDPEHAINQDPEQMMALYRIQLPDAFDGREQWPKCAGVIGHIRDQSNCGSCWAHGTTEALNDRLCVANGFTDLLSVSDTTGCCGFLRCQSMGCNGGQVGTPWNWFDSTGVVTGGDYGDGTLCYDYTMPKCAHHVTDPSLPECSDVKQVDPSCDRSCPSNTKIDYSSDKHKA
eukprot:UN24357